MRDFQELNHHTTNVKKTMENKIYLLKKEVISPTEIEDQLNHVRVLHIFVVILYVTGETHVLNTHSKLVNQKH